MKITLKGDKELLDLLKQKAPEDVKTALRKATRAGAKIMLNEIRSTAPERTGALKRATKLQQRSRKGEVKTVVKTDTQKAFYAGFVEFGTKHQKGLHYQEKAGTKLGQQALDVTIQTMREELGTGH